MTKELRVFGLPEDALRQRLADLLEDASVEVTLSVCEGHGVVTLSASPSAVEALAEEVSLRLTGYVYGQGETTLAAEVVGLLASHRLTVATAESCTGGLIAAALTDIPGASAVLGTGVVSYSNDCKERLLSVSPETLSAQGAVSAATAGQMARGVRQTSEAAIGVAVTGEAGPQPAENWPVGTVFMALADKKRTWVEELHLDGPDRASVRRQATDWVLWLLWKYLSAYPATMAGGEVHTAARRREIPRGKEKRHPGLLARLIPWRGDSLRWVLFKSCVWLVALLLLGGCLYGGYRYLSESDRNRELQSSLGQMYWESTDLTDGTAQPGYPGEMLPAFRDLYDRNRDVAGWLYVPATGIDYPVMQYADGYYSNHSFLQEYSSYGQLYFAPSANQNIRCIHGQNPGDGQMFSDLLNYRRLAYLQGHSTLQCSTLTANESWQIFAVLVVDDQQQTAFSYFPETTLKGAQEFLTYAEELCRRSLFTADITLSADDQILLLTTEAEEAYHHAGARLVVAARKIAGEAVSVSYRTNHQVQWPAFLAGTTRRPIIPTTTTTKKSTTGTTETVTTTTEETTTTTATTETTESATTEESTTTSDTTATSTQESASTETVPSTEGTTIPTAESGTED